MIQFLFWLAAVTVFYTYFGFPLLVFLRGILKRRSIQYGSITPSINVIIVAHNEAKRRIRFYLDKDLIRTYEDSKIALEVALPGRLEMYNFFGDPADAPKDFFKGPAALCLLGERHGENI